ncbi:MAG: ATP-binding protein, partial [Halobacteriaceae archaeon]
EMLRAKMYLSNFLIGGSIGGTLTGLYAYQGQVQREKLQTQANRLEVLNRMLRHKILNAVTSIRGYANYIDHAERSAEVIRRQTVNIEETIEEIKYLARSDESRLSSHQAVDLNEHLATSINQIQDTYQNVNITVDGTDDTLYVQANAHLKEVFVHLLENAVVHSDSEQTDIDITVTKTATNVAVSISDSGPGLPVSQQSLLETGDIETFDDPGTGFGLNIVRFLVTDFGGSIETSVDTTGTTIHVRLPRPRSNSEYPHVSQPHLQSIRPALPYLIVTLGASILAGVVYGIISMMFGDTVAGIGVFYGTADIVVGWIAHEFHSIVFGFIYLSILSVIPERYHSGIEIYLATGIGWAVILWIVAAGIIAPIWLRLLGISLPIPRFSFSMLLSHIAWGISLAIGSYYGFKYLVHKFQQFFDHPIFESTNM